MYSVIRKLKRKSGTETKLMRLFEKYIGKYDVESEEHFYNRLLHS